MTISYQEKNLEKITWVDKIGEIGDGFCDEEYNYFGKITSICIDKIDDILYVADSELHKIFRFNIDGEFIDSFGTQGQGPGEFLGILRISIGNNGNLYVTDEGNRRLLVFSKSGKFIEQLSISSFLRDRPIIGSNGDIYLLSPSRLRVIDVFDKNMRLKTSILEMKYHSAFPFFSPPKTMLPAVLKPSINNVKKLITKDDNLIVVFNNTQKIIHLNQNHIIVKEFKIDHPEFIKDYKHRLKASIKNRGWLNCFGSAFLDTNENICLCYYNGTQNRSEVYRYTKGGIFKDIIKVRNSKIVTNKLFVVCTKKGNLFSISQESTKIIIYRLPE